MPHTISKSTKLPDDSKSECIWFLIFINLVSHVNYMTNIVDLYLGLYIYMSSFCGFEVRLASCANLYVTCMRVFIFNTEKYLLHKFSS